MALKTCMQNGRFEAGCDEAGRGCLAGPVYAAAVILPEGFSHDLLDDSKKLNESQRDQLRLVIEEQALAWSVQSLDPEVIDDINILNASIQAMQLAVRSLSHRPDHLLIDGNRFYPIQGYTHTCVVKGDAIYQSIAAASILAKTHRDEHMRSIHDVFPVYNWASNKGYPTAAHRQAILENGACVHHRRSFRLLKDPQIVLFK